MVSLLLIIIYLAFISLGLPDSLVGSAWPVMHAQLGVPVSYAGILTMVISAGTIFSSLFSNKLTAKFGAGTVTAVSVLLTAGALLGFSFSNQFYLLCLFAIPYGFGAGAVDAALNNYVALHFASRHMNWLHCFWGVGASLSPFIMSFCLTGGAGWTGGFRTVFIIQIILTLFLFVSLPLWKKKAQHASKETHETPPRMRDVIRIKGVASVLITFFAYCALEQTAGLWASSYLVQYKALDAGLAAQFASLFFIGITVGRAICGFISDKVGDKRLIRFGIIIMMVGVALIVLPIKTSVFSLIGLIVIGLGCAPVYPSIIHATPFRFGRENSQAIIGMQMASAYIGATFMPLVFGFLAQQVHIGLYAAFLGVFAVLMIVMSEVTNKRAKIKPLTATMQ